MLVKTHGQTLYNEDCMDVLDRLSDIDIVITSPPYNLGIKYNSYNDKLSKKEYEVWLTRIFLKIKDCMKESSSFFLNIGASSQEPWVAFDVANIARNIFILQNHIIWAKSITVGEDSFGHFKPINSERFINHNFEHVFHFTNTGKVKLDKLGIGVPYADKSNIARWGKTADKRCRGDIWFIPYDTIQNKKEKANHPAIFPVQLAEWCIKLHGFNSQTQVLDPFLGTGSTLVACKDLGVCGFGVEIDKDYFDSAVERLKND